MRSVVMALAMMSVASVAAADTESKRLSDAELDTVAGGFELDWLAPYVQLPFYTNGNTGVLNSGNRNFGVGNAGTRNVGIGNAGNRNNGIFLRGGSNTGIGTAGFPIDLPFEFPTGPSS